MILRNLGLLRSESSSMLSIIRRSVVTQICRRCEERAVDDVLVAVELDDVTPKERASFPSGEMKGLSEIICNYTFAS